VLLRATVRDSSIVPSSGDAAPGDIRNATVTFKEGATTLCGPLPVTLLNGATTIGGANCTVSLPVGAHTITVLVSSYYTGTTTAVAEVIAPNGKFVTGGGYLVLGGSSAGALPGNAGSKMDFELDAKLKKSYQGNLSVTFKSGTKTYKITSTSLDSIAAVQRNAGGANCTGKQSPTCFGLADARATAKLTEGNTVIGTNLTLRVTVTDKGEPGRDDSVGVTLWNGGTLLFSSSWTGAATAELLLGGGNTVVH
jgi:hypothetical protein